MKNLKVLVLVGIITLVLGGCNSAEKGQEATEEKIEQTNEEESTNQEDSGEVSKIEDFEYESRGEGTIQISGYNGTASKVVIPEEINGLIVEAIGISAFEDNEVITDIQIPGTVKYIDKMAFYDCKQLVKVEFSEGLEEIGASAFENCKSIKDFNLPESVNKLGYAMCRWAGIQTLHIPGNIDSIPEDAFSICRGLTGTVTIPANVKTVGPHAFMHCDNVEKFVLEDGVETLEENAFGECENLKSVTVPASVTSIEITAFMGSLNVKLIVEAGSEAESFAGDEIPFEVIQ